MTIIDDMVSGHSIVAAAHLFSIAASVAVVVCCVFLVLRFWDGISDTSFAATATVWDRIKGSLRQKSFIKLAVAVVIAVSASVIGDYSWMALLRSAVQVDFPNTKIAGVTCKNVTAGLCEVTAGKTVFYVSHDGRFAVVGAILDLQKRVDLTEERTRQLGDVATVADRLAGGTQAAVAPPPAAPVQSGLSPSLKVDLPVANAIVRNPGAPLKLTVISDLNCGYCRMLFDALKSVTDIEVTEYPIQLLRPDSADKAKLALCASDRPGAANQIYFGGEVKVAGDCAAAAKAVAQNTDFARAHGIQGTPTLIRPDGRTNAGFMPIDQLRAWIKAGS